MVDKCLRGTIAPLLAFALTACSSPSDDDTAGRLAQLRGVVFLAQAEQPDAVMEALFEGRIVLDDGGCLRLDSPDGSTVVWPHGSSLESDEDGLRVVDDRGREIGRIGASFKLGGGHVASLHGGIAATNAAREAAQASCPGNFWIVGDVVD